MPDTGGQAWRSLLVCCEEKAQGQGEEVELASIPRTSSVPRETRTASLPPDQISLRSLPTTNPGVKSLQRRQYSITEPTPDVQDRTPTSISRHDLDLVSDHDAAIRKLWVEAMTKVKASKDGDKLAEVMDAQENIQTANDLITSEELIRKLEQEMKRVGLKGKMADTMDKVVPHLNRFAIVGDVAVSANPNPAALPWAAVRFILLNLTAGGDIRAKIVEGIAKVTILILECSVYQRLYLDSISTEDPELFGRLRDTIVNSFVHSLRFLGFALNRQRSRAKVATDAFKLQDFVGYLEELADAEKQLDEAGGLCEKYHNSQGRERLDDLYKLVIDIQSDRADEKLQTQLKDLLLLDPMAASDHIHHPPDSFCLNGTREAVLAEIHDWVNDSKGPSICWLPGLAGTGKSTIARTLSRDLKGTALAGSFFFKRGVANRGDATRTVPLIAYQLALNLPPVAGHIAEALQNDPSSVTAPLAIQWSRLVLHPLSKLTTDELPTTLVLVIDALDECDSDSDRRGILRLMTMSCPMTLKVFLTSRPELDIEGFFAAEESSRHEIVLHRVKLEDIQKDIEAFLKNSIDDFVSEYNRVHPAKRSQLLAGWPGDERLQLLVNRSVPLFIAAATFVRMIRDHKWSLNPNRKVDFIIEKSSSVTSRYAVLYKPVLSLILSGTPNEAQNETKEGFQKVVGSIILLADPLSIGSLASLLGVEVPEVDSQIDPLRSVLDISADDCPIRLFHLSFRDYLLSEMAGDLRVDEVKIHANLASRCMHIMRTRLKTDICGLESPGSSRTDLDQETIDKNIPPELLYACMYWVHHLKSSGQRVRDDDHAEGVLSFLRNLFLNWLEVLCLCGVSLRIRTMLEELQSIVHEDAGTEVLRFLHDARRFWSHFGEGVKEFPLQLYHSGIVFCPTESTAPQPAENRHYPKWIAQPSTVGPHWAPYIQILEYHKHHIDSITFLANGRLVSNDDGGNIHVWDPDTGAHLQIQGPPHESLLRLASWRDSKLASRSQDGCVRIYSLVDGTCLQELLIDGFFCHLAFSDDGKFLCSIPVFCAEDELLEEGQIVDLTSGHCIRRLNLNRKFLASALSEKGQWMANTMGKLIKLSRWSAHGDSSWIELGPHSDGVNEVVFSTSGTLLASVSGLERATGTVMVWCTETGECLHVVQTPNIIQLAISYERLAFIPDGGQVVIVNLATKSVFKILQSQSINSLTFSADGKLLATATSFVDPVIRIWDSAEAQSSDIADSHFSEVLSLSLMSDGSTLLSSSRTEVKIWDIPSGMCRETLKMSQKHIDGRQFSAARCRPLFAIQKDEDFEIWRFGPLECIQTIKAKYVQDRYTFYHLVMSATGQQLAVSPANWWEKTHPGIEVWNVKTGRLILTLRDGLVRFSTLTFSPDDARIAYTTQNTVEVFDISGPHLLSIEVRERPHNQYPFSFSFSFDGQRIVFTSRDGGGRVWDSNTGRALCVWSGRSGFEQRPPDASLLNIEAIADTRSTENLDLEDMWKPYHINEDGIWLVKHKERLLWLPPDYRPSVACMSGSTMAIGSMLGRVLFLYLKD